MCTVSKSECHEGLVRFVWAADEFFAVVDAEPLEISDFFPWVVDLDEGPATVNITIKIACIYMVCICDIRR